MSMTDEVKTFLVNMVIVSISSAFAKTINAPMDRIKLILQNQHSALQVLKGERQQYKGFIDCLTRLPKEQGFWSFWRGNGANILRYFPTQALNFAFNDFYKRTIHNMFGDTTPTRSVVINFVSGGLAGFCAASIMYPLDFCQTRIAVDIGGGRSTRSKTKQEIKVKREFYGVIDCVRKVQGVEGFKGLYSGYSVAVVGITIYRAMYFGIFDTLKYLWSGEDVGKVVIKPPLFLGLIFAQSATCMSGFIIYPLDTVSRRLMFESGRPKELRLFTSSYDAFRVMYKKEGITSFYRGGMTNCLRGLSGALVLVFYDEILHYTNWKQWFSPCDNC